jgi:DNA-binding NtrC family response regulator
MKNERKNIGVFSTDSNLLSVCEVLLKKSGFEVESFKSLQQLLDYPAINNLSGIIIAGVKGNKEDIELILTTIKQSTSFPIIILSTFSDQVSPDGRVRVYPASFSWKKMLNDLAGFVNNSQKENDAGFWRDANEVS